MEESNIYTSEDAKHTDLDLPLANAESMPIHTLTHSDWIAEKNAQREREKETCRYDIVATSLSLGGTRVDASFTRGLSMSSPFYSSH